MSERRVHARLVLSVPVEIATEAGEARDLETSDLSPGGAFIETGSPIPLDTVVHGHFHLESIGASVKLQGRVVRHDPRGMAIQFTEHGRLGWKLLERLLEAELTERSE